MTLNVTTIQDEDFNSGDLTAERNDGAGLSLREAIALGATGVPGQISFDSSLAGSTFTLSNGPLNIDFDAILNGDANTDALGDITIQNILGTPVLIFNTDGVDFRNEFTALVANGTATSESRGRTILIDADDVTFENSGEIFSIGSTANFGGDRSTAIEILGDGFTFVNDMNASVISSGRVGVGVVFDVNGSAIDTNIVNDGLIEAQDDAIRLVQGTIENNGTIRTTGTFDFGGIFLPGEVSDAIQTLGELPPGFTPDPAGLLHITNNFDGVIEGARSAIFMNGGGSVTNAGTISADVAAIVTQSWYTSSGPIASSFALDNSGTISRGVESYGFNSGTEVATIMIFGDVGGLSAPTITNSGSILAPDLAISSNVGVDLTNTLMGRIDSNSGIAFRGGALEDYLVMASIAFPNPTSDLLSSQAVSVNGSGELVVSGVAYAFPANQAQAAYLGVSDVAGILPLIDIAETQNQGQVVYQLDGAGNPLFAATMEVVSAEFGTLTVNYAAGTGFEVLNAGGDTFFAVPTGLNFDDVIDNNGIIVGDIFTGLGDDIVINTATLNGTVDLGAGNDTYDGTNSFGFTSVNGGTGNDTITSGPGGGFFNGGDGNDTITVLDAYAEISGGAGDDILTGGDGEQRFYGDSGSDTIAGGAGNDRMSYFESTSGVTVDLLAGTASGGDAQGDTLSGIENLQGSDFADILTGNDGANNLFGRDGDDILIGGGGDDILEGQGGYDTLTGGTGADIFTLEDYGLRFSGEVTDLEESDQIIILTDYFFAANFIDLFIGTDAFSNTTGEIRYDHVGGQTILQLDVDGDAVADETFTITNGLFFLEATSLNSGAFSLQIEDRIVGTLGNDILNGTSGDDKINGLDGNDTLIGGDGADALDGGDGEDVADYATSNSGVIVNLTSGTGELGDAQGDTLTNIENVTGSGFADTIVGDASSNILSGGGGDDVISGLEGIDTLNGGDGDDILIGGAGADIFTGGLGEDMFSTTVSGYLDLNGDRITDFTSEDSIVIEGVIGAGIGNYILVDDGLGGGTIDIFGAVLSFDNLAAGSEFVSIIDRLFGLELVLYEAGGLDFVLDENRGDFIAELDEATVLVTAGTQLSGRLDLDAGTDFDVVNDGTVAGIYLEGTDSTLTNTGLIANATWGVFFSTLEVNDPSNAAFTNGATGVINNVAIGVNILAGSTFDPTAPGMDVVVINNDGLIESSFNGIAGGTQDSLTINNSGTFRTAFDAASTLNVSLGMTASGLNQTTLNNSGVIEVLSAEGGFTGEEAVAISGGSNGGDGGTYDLINSGRISSTGTALRLGGSSETDGISYVNIINTATGLIEGDTNGNDDGIAIRGSSGFLIDNLPGVTFEVLNQYSIDNAGTIIGDIELYDEGYFELNASLGFAFIEGRSLQVLNVPGVEGPILPEQDENGDPILDGSGNPVFLPGSATVDGVGVINYSVTDGVPSLTDQNGDPVVLLPDADDLNRGVFNDTFVNSGTVDGDIFLGVGDDSFIATGTGSVSGTVYGGLGNDTLMGADSIDRFDGGAGNDILSGGAGADMLGGGAGFDIASYAGSSAGVIANLFTGQGNRSDAAGDTYTNIEALRGSSFNDVLVGRDGAGDTLLGGQGNDSLRANGGNDFVFGEGGNDLIFAGFGADTINGGSGIDTLMLTNASAGTIIRLDLGTGAFNVAAGDSYTNIENVAGSAFRDLLYGDDGVNFLDGRGGDDLLIGNGGADILDGGAGFDTVSYANSAVGVSASLFAGTGPENDIIRNVEHLVGSSFDDTLTGSNGTDDRLDGGDGADNLRGNGGNDILNGEGGDDILISGFGADTHDGGGGIDTITYAGASAGVIVRLDLGTGALGHAAGDTYANIENVTGSSGFRDLLYGNTGNNVIDGGGGNDLLIGNAGSDTLIGGAGSDKLNGGTGFDVLSGGAGNDVFVFEAGYRIDRVTDFTIGQDQVDLSSFGYTMYSQVSSLMYTDGADTVLTFGGGDAIRLVGISLGDLSASDFMITPTPGNAPAAKSDFAADVDSFDFADDFTPQDQSMAFMQQALIAEFTASQAMNVPIYKANDYGVLEILTPDDPGYDFGEWGA